MSTPYRNTVRHAIAQHAASVGIVPTTTIADPGGIAIGATFFTAASASDARNFVPGGYVFFTDIPDEPLAVVSSVTGSIVTLTWQTRLTSARTPQVGTLFAHAHGALIATNLIFSRSNPGDASRTKLMCANGYPVLRVLVRTSKGQWTEMRARQEFPVATVIHQLPQEQMSGSNKMDLELWRGQQLDRGEADIETLVGAVFADYTLTAGTTPLESFVRAWAHAHIDNVRDAKTPLYEHYLNLYIEGQPLDVLPKY